jgi:hypothetical protein
MTQYGNQTETRFWAVAAPTTRAEAPVGRGSGMLTAATVGRDAGAPTAGGLLGRRFAAVVASRVCEVAPPQLARHSAAAAASPAMGCR